jgi:hypothetical protein
MTPRFQGGMQLARSSASIRAGPDNVRGPGYNDEERIPVFRDGSPRGDGV